MSVTHEKTLSKPFDAAQAARATEMARETLQIEADAILALKNRITSNDGSFAQAVGLVLL